MVNGDPYRLHATNSPSWITNRPFAVCWPTVQHNDVMGVGIIVYLAPLPFKMASMVVIVVSIHLMSMRLQDTVT